MTWSTPIILALLPSTVLAHPGGAAVSMGSNPIVSFGGELTMPTSGSVSTDFSAPEGSDLVITDVSLSGSTNHSDCSENWPVTFTLAGVEIAKFTAGPNLLGSGRIDQRFQQSFTSGIRIPAGQTMTMSTYRAEWNGSCSWSRTAEFRWTLSGYYAQS